MPFQQVLVVIILGCAVLASLNCYKAKNKVYCTFTRKDKTIGHKWARPVNGERFEFEGGWRYVIMSCITLEAMDSGVNMVFPTMIRCLHFSYGNSLPNNPDTGEPVDLTPEAREALDKREDIEALEKGSQVAMGKGKLGLTGGWVTLALIIGVAISLYFGWQNSQHIDMLGNGQNVMESMLGKIMQKIGLP